MLKTNEITWTTPLVHFIEYHFSGQPNNFKTPLKPLQSYVLPKALNTDSLLHVESLFLKPESPRPNWLGYMQSILHEEHLPNAAITLLPVIEWRPSCCTCIYKTLLIVTNQCKNCNINTPWIIFDQLLWLKTTDIAIKTLLDISVHLWVFLTPRSFAGSMGSLMDGSGIARVCETVSGEDTVKHKIVERQLERHYIHIFFLKVCFNPKATTNTFLLMAKTRNNLMQYQRQEKEEIEMGLSYHQDLLEMANVEVTKKLHFRM